MLTLLKNLNLSEFIFSDIFKVKKEIINKTIIERKIRRMETDIVATVCPSVNSFLKKVSSKNISEIPPSVPLTAMENNSNFLNGMPKNSKKNCSQNKFKNASFLIDSFMVVCEEKKGYIKLTHKPQYSPNPFCLLSFTISSKETPASSNNCSTAGLICFST